ncbi:hypothetical protein AB0B94_31145 [Micromonospora sp. NPDC048986]|uniref:hypothetical protein n=1 Tax=Micromonospora sp. NPDC048986 TaxID=3155644 RepID=UPI0033FF99D0
MASTSTAASPGGLNFEPEAATDDDWCCRNCSGTYDEESGEHLDDRECCCTCLGCEYGPRDGMLMFPERGAQ